MINHIQGINRKIGIGVLWNLASLFMSRGASAVITLLLARILVPEAFGLIAMITICFELAGTLADSGLGQALIQSKKVSQKDFSTVFISNLVLSVIAYALLFFTAPYIALFYSQPKLTLLIQVAGIVVLINAFKVVQIAALSREMDFRSQMTANTLGVLVSGCLSVSLAYYGFGVWSLIAQMVSFAFVSAGILWITSEWRPSAEFSHESFKRLFRFGGYLLIAGITSVIYQNTYLLVIGRLFTPEVTGLYFFARKISNLVSQNLTNAVQNATFPALSMIQQQNVALRYKYRQIIQLMIALIAPIMLLLSSLAAPLIDFLFDDKWQGAALYLQLFCIVGLLFPLHALNTNLLKVKGRSDLVLKIGLIKKAVSIALLFMAIPLGVTGIIISQIIASFLALLPNTYFSAKLIDYGLKDQVMDAIKPISISALSCIVAWYSVHLLRSGVLSKIVLSGLSGILMYLFLSYLFKSEGVVILHSKLIQRFKTTN